MNDQSRREFIATFPALAAAGILLPERMRADSPNDKPKLTDQKPVTATHVSP